MNPEVRLKYAGTIDLAETGKFAGMPELRAGTLDVNGTVVYERSTYLAQGNAAGHNLTWKQASTSIAGVDFSSPFAITHVPEIRMAALEFGLCPWKPNAMVMLVVGWIIIRHQPA